MNIHNYENRITTDGLFDLLDCVARFGRYPDISQRLQKIIDGNDHIYEGPNGKMIKFKYNNFIGELSFNDAKLPTYGFNLLSPTQKGIFKKDFESECINVAVKYGNRNFKNIKWSKYDLSSTGSDKHIKYSLEPNDWEKSAVGSCALSVYHRISNVWTSIKFEIQHGWYIPQLPGSSMPLDINNYDLGYTKIL